MPQALPYIYLAVAAAGTAATLYAQDTQTQQLESNQKYAADQAAADAATAKGEAEVEAERIRKAGKAQQAQAVAAAAASGVDVNSPTALKINQDIYANADEDARLTILNGADSAARLNQQAALDRQGAAITATNGRQAQVGTLLSAAGSMMQTASNWKKQDGGG